VARVITTPDRFFMMIGFDKAQLPRADGSSRAQVLIVLPAMPAGVAEKVVLRRVLA
jgi:hypothetical protein